MLNYFFTRSQLPVVNTQASYPLQLKSSEAYVGKVIPFDHIYIASNPHLKRIKKSLGDEKGKLIELSSESQARIESDKRFPKELKGIGLSSKKALQKHFNTKDSIDIVVVNGVGTGFGDNYVGLGLMQFIQRMVAPTKVTFHLMQNFNKRTVPIYMHDENILVYSNCITIKKWFSMDYYVNLVGMLGFDSFDDLPLVQFYAEQFGVEKIIKNQNLLPGLSIDTKKVNIIQSYLERFFNEPRPLILIHPQASSPLRSMPDEVAKTTVNRLIKQGFNVINASSFSYDSDNDDLDADSSGHYCDISHLSDSIDDLVHIVKVSDAVVSVGTVTYHIAAALGKPTWLLPTVQADVYSASEMKTVSVFLGDKLKQHLSNKHKSRLEEDISEAGKIWDGLDLDKLSKTIWKHLH